MLWLFVVAVAAAGPTAQSSAAPAVASAPEDSTAQLVAVADVNQSIFSPGQTLAVTIGLTNPGLLQTADVYAGLLRPDGTIQFFTETGLKIGSLASFASFQPILAGFPLDAPFSVTVPNFYTYKWTGEEPHGDYVLFVLVVRAGALSATGGIANDAILALATTPFSFP